MAAVPFPSILTLDAEEFLCAPPPPLGFLFYDWLHSPSIMSTGIRLAFLRLASAPLCALRFLKMVVLLENIVTNRGSKCDLLRTEAASFSFPAQKAGMLSLEIHSAKRSFRRQP